MPANLCRFLPACFLAVALTPATRIPSAVGSEKVLYSFRGGSDGSVPWDGLISDGAGNLYGTTAGGGTGTNCFEGSTYGCGTVFKLAPGGTETVIYSFAGGCDGALPVAGLVADKAGNLYGTTEHGGICNDPQHGYGTVFKIVPDGTESVLYAFQNGSDGSGPTSNLIVDGAGNLYGESTGGGQQQCCGAVFKVSPQGALTVLHFFQGGSDGAGPSSVIMDIAGNLFGTTGGGGGSGCGGVGCGTIFEIAADGTESVLYAFQGGNDGERPLTGVIEDSIGNFYGTTELGGSKGYGTVFKFAAGGTESVLYAFKGGNDGYTPMAGLTMDKAGNLYGTTLDGGGTHCQGSGCGTVFKLAPSGAKTVLFAFHASDGRWPAAPLLKGPNGLLYGTTTEGGINNNGVVFRVKK